MTNLERDNIRLRAIGPEDLDHIRFWENDPTLSVHYSQVTPLSRFALRQYIEEWQKDLWESRQLYLIIEYKGVSVGSIQLYDLEPLHRTAKVGIFVLPSFQRKGIALTALSMICDYAKTTLQLQQLRSDVMVDNPGGITLFEKGAFTECGLLKRWLWHNGTFRDIVILQRLF